MEVDLEQTTTKLGGCHTFNKVQAWILWKDSISQYVSRYRKTKVEDLLMERWTEPLYVEKPMKTTNKDLGLEMKIIEGSRRFMEFRESFNVGYQLMVHSSYELPDETIPHFQLAINGSYIVYVKPHLTTIDDTLVNLTPEE